MKAEHMKWRDLCGSGMAEPLGKPTAQGSENP